MTLHPQGNEPHQAFVLHDYREPAGAHAFLPSQRVRQPHIVRGVLRKARWCSGPGRRTRAETGSPAYKAGPRGRGGRQTGRIDCFCQTKAVTAVPQQLRCMGGFGRGKRLQRCCLERADTGPRRRAPQK